MILGTADGMGKLAKVSRLFRKMWNGSGGEAEDLDATDGPDAIDRLFAQFVKVANQFKDLNFADPSGTIQLRQRIPSVTCVRIELPKTEYLHLSNVLIEADGISDVRHEAVVRASSTLPAYSQLLEQGVLLDPANTQTALHTKKEDRPWLEIVFDRPVDVTRVFVRNVSDQQTSSRARGLQILVREQGAWWTTIYDGWLRERAFVRAVERQQRRQALARRARSRVGRMFSGGQAASDADSTAGTEDRIPGLARILTAAQLGDYATVPRELRRAGVSPAEESRFRDVVNERIARREVEWSIHGIERTFRFWSKQEKQDYIGFAADVVECLRELNDNVCFGFGTVLGIVRDHQLIPHDYDADVIIGFEPDQASTLREGRALIRECLVGHGYTVSKKRVAHHFVTRPEGGPKLDVFAGVFEQDMIAWFPARRGGLTRQMMFPPQYVSFLDRSCPIPREPEQYLEQIYGPGWRTPDPTFGHAWTVNRRGYSDIRG